MQNNKNLTVDSDDGDMMILFCRTTGAYFLAFRSLSMTQALRFATIAALEASVATA